MRKKLFSFSLLLVFGCQSANQSTLLNPTEFNDKISTSQVQILDVRTKEEYDLGHISNAVLIDVQKENFDENTKVLYKDLPIYVYCKRGVRSHNASAKLKSLGFKEIYELKGGFDEWLNYKLPSVESMPEKIYESDTIPFTEAIKGDKLVLVDFNATWCGPCKVLQPTIDRIHTNRSDEVIVYSIDVDRHRDLALKYEAERIPLIMMFKNNTILERIEGLMGEAELNQLVDKHR